MSEPVTDTDLSLQVFYHGTRSDLKPGDLVETRRTSNFSRANKSKNVYLTCSHLGHRAVQP